MHNEDVGGLVTSAADGDAAAWNALVGRFTGLVWSVARAQGLSRDDAEEVGQITWFRLADHIGRIKEPDRIGGWLATTARHEALKLLRASRRVGPVPDTDAVAPAVDDHSPEASVLAAEEAADQAERLHGLWAAFQDLPDRCRRLLGILSGSPPPSYAEIAAALEMPVGSVGPTRARCLQRLRGLLAERGVRGTG
ncbi:RNA polymerase sigma factor [Actinomadura scrupuli]|uniref:RNA polymerase sigma factor n=1 Tax=Actinomadura scrupuli TaxID=559629 RepID=UPI003D9832AB